MSNNEDDVDPIDTTGKPVSRRYLNSLWVTPDCEYCLEHYSNPGNMLLLRTMNTDEGRIGIWQCHGCGKRIRIPLVRL